MTISLSNVPQVRPGLDENQVKEKNRKTDQTYNVAVKIISYFHKDKGNNALMLNLNHIKTKDLMCKQRMEDAIDRVTLQMYVLCALLKSTNTHLKTFVNSKRLTDKHLRPPHMFENDTNVIQIRFSSAVSVTTSVVCTGLQLQDCTFKTVYTHYKSMYCHHKC